ncbi:MAG: 3-hydroxybutyrate dehydrogenase [Phycisphaerales bacterium]|nr:3-hydroxybutyrate dehydrogenase [Phycisphaerales bacterium]
MNIAHLKDKKCLITGGTSGIGLSIALALAKIGAHIVVNGRETEFTSATEQFEHARVQAQFHPADLTQEAQIIDLIKFAGAVDILVNSAGIQHVALTEEFPVHIWNQIIALNLTACFHTSRLLLPAMKKKQWGRIINIASTHGLVGSGGKSAYVSAKHGLVGLTKTIALENATTGITCNAICPGWVNTPLVQKQIHNIATEKKVSVEIAAQSILEEKEPTLKFTEPEHIGDMVLFFCSTAGDNITGVAWNMDGGWTAR